MRYLYEKRSKIPKRWWLRFPFPPAAGGFALRPPAVEPLKLY